MVGIDISEGMVERVVGEIHRRGLLGASAVRMDAESIDFPEGSFDFVLCGMGLFFFPGLDNALDGFLRVLRPNGHLAASTFRSVKDGKRERWQELRDAYRDHLRPANTLRKPTMSSDEEVRQTLLRSGFVDIEVVEKDPVFYYKDEEDWWQEQWATFRQDFLERLDANMIDHYRQRAFELLRQDKTERGIPWTWHLLYSKARKPS